MTDARQNAKATRIVEEGIALARQGRYEAARFMLAEGVRFSVIVRALAPGLGRSVVRAASDAHAGP